MKESSPSSPPPPPPNDFDASIALPTVSSSSSFPAMAVSDDNRALQAAEKMEVEEKIETETEIPGTTCLKNFCRPDATELKFTDDLKQILEVIASTGNYWHEWSMLKCLLSFRMKQVLAQYHDLCIASGGPEKLIIGETFPDLEKRLLEYLDLFVDGPPFTLQRLCELLLNPRATYPNIDKAALAFEKLLLVTSTIPACKDPYPPCRMENKVDEVSIVGVENGTPEKTDQEMLDRHMDGEALDNEASTSSENNMAPLTSKDNHVVKPDFEGVQVLNQQSPSVNDDDLVDIPLDDKSPNMQA